MKMTYKKIPEERVNRLKIVGKWQCPSCLGIFSIENDFPAISRYDNETNLCTNCGLIEAMNDYADAVSKKKPLEKLDV